MWEDYWDSLICECILVVEKLGDSRVVRVHIVLGAGVAIEAVIEGLNGIDRLFPTQKELLKCSVQ